MKTRIWCLASASVLCLCLGTPTFADNRGPSEVLGSTPNGQGRAQAPGPSSGQGRPSGNFNGGGYNGNASQQPRWQPQPGYNSPQGNRPGQGWQNNPNGDAQPRPQPTPPASSVPIRPKPDEVLQTQPPLRGHYPDLPRPDGNRHWQAGGERDRDWGRHGDGWGPGPQYRPGQRIDRFPGDPYRVPYRGNDYFYSSGYWYRPDRAGYVVVPPPRGIRVRYLPDYATRMWIGGGMFFLAAGTYYQWVNDTQEYVVVDPPVAQVQSQAQPVPQPAAAPSGYDVAFYPANGQTPSQMERDRYDCQRWAAQQTGFDPATATYAPSDEVVYLFRQNMANCLASRGYGLN